MKTIDGYLCYLDVLGFTSLYELTTFQARYKELENHIRDNYSGAQNFYVYLLADSVIVFADEIDIVTNVSIDLYYFGLNKGIWMRGGLSKGGINIPHDFKCNNHILLPFLGHAYLEAQRLEKNINCTGIYVGDDLSGDIDSSKTIKYGEWFPKPGTPKEKMFLFRDLGNNWSISSTHFNFIHLKHCDEIPVDIEKYVNTYCLYMKILRKENTNQAGFDNWLLDHLMEILQNYSSRIVLPNEFIVVFIDFIEGLRDRSGDETNHQRVNELIRKVIAVLKEKGFLAVFMEYIKRLNKTDIIYSINRALS